MVFNVIVSVLLQLSNLLVFDVIFGVFEHSRLWYPFVPVLVPTLVVDEVPVIVIVIAIVIVIVPPLVMDEVPIIVIVIVIVPTLVVDEVPGWFRTGSNTS